MLLTIILCVVLVAADQLFKFLAATYLGPGGAVTLIPGVVELRYLENTGAAFSILEGRQTLLIILTGAALLAILAILIFKRPKDKLTYLALVFFLAGGIGNWVDRIFQNYVVDYISFLFIDFAVFNFADIMVCTGFVLLVVGMLRSEYKSHKAQQTKVAAGGSATAENSDTLQNLQHKEDPSGPKTDIQNDKSDDVISDNLKDAAKPVKKNGDD